MGSHLFVSMCVMSVVRTMSARRYNRALIFPAIVGLGWFIAQVVGRTPNVSYLIVFALFVNIWSTVFIETWKRQQARLAFRWGQQHHRDHESVRPEFQPSVERISAVNGKKEKHFHFCARIKRLLLSQTIIFTFVVVVCAATFGTLVVRNLLQRWSPTWGVFLTSCINAVQIQIMNVVYGLIRFVKARR